MLDNHAELLRLIGAAGGTVQGRTKLQKLVYLAQQKGWPFTESFRYYLYGPYSEQLASEIEEIRCFGFVTESKQQGHGSALCYTLTDEGRRFIDEYTPRPLPHGIEEFVADASARESRILELYATVLYLNRIGYGDDEVSDMIGSLKPDRDYSAEAITGAQEFLRVHRLVAQNPPSEAF